MAQLAHITYSFIITLFILLNTAPVDAEEFGQSLSDAASITGHCRYAPEGCGND